MAQGNNPAILAAARARNAGRAGVDVARGRLAPQFDLVGNAGFVVDPAGPDVSTTPTSASSAEFRFPLFDGGLLAVAARAARSSKPTAPV